MYKVVIFDVDGTLFDTSMGICNCINYVLEKNGESTLDDCTLKKFIGPPIYESYMKICNKTYEDAMKYTEEYRENYISKYINQSQPYSYMEDVINEIKSRGIKVAIATLKTQIQVDVLLKNQGVENLFDLVVGVRKSGESKSDILKTIIQCFEIADGKQAVLVGDTYLDAKGANDVGIDFIGVTHGFGIKDYEDVKGLPCKFICDSLPEMLLKL